MKPAGFVLTGGKSRRMGTDKAELEWGGRTLAAHMHGLLSSIADPVAFVGPGNLIDREPGAGPVEGMRTALEATRSDSNIVVAVDLPFLAPEWLLYLVDRLEQTGRGVVAVEIEGSVPLAVAIHRGMRDALDVYRKRGERRLRGFLENVGADLIDESELREAGFDRTMFRNLNTPDDYARYRPR